MGMGVTDHSSSRLPVASGSLLLIAKLIARSFQIFMRSGAKLLLMEVSSGEAR